MFAVNTACHSFRQNFSVGLKRLYVMKKYDGKTGILLQLDAENCKNRNKHLLVTSVIRIPFLFVLLSPLLFFQH